MKRAELQKLSKAQLVEMFADEIHNWDVVFQYDHTDPGVINWYWNGETSGNDDIEDFVKTIFPGLLKEEIEWVHSLDYDPNDDIPF